MGLQGSLRKEVVVPRQKVTIQRARELRYERSVVVNFPTRPPLTIDPQDELFRVTGCNASRSGCVVSMADGFQSAGYEVTVVTYFYDSMQRHPHSNRFPTVYLYWLLGYALAYRTWDNLKAELRRVPAQKRFEVLEATAEYYYACRHEPRKLMAPISLLLNC